MNVVMILVEMEGHAKMVSTNTFVNVDLVMRVVSVKERSMNANPILVSTEVPATDTLIHIHAHAWKVLLVATVRKISTIVN